jgi:hypothetical protein
MQGKLQCDRIAHHVVTSSTDLHPSKNSRPFEPSAIASEIYDFRRFITAAMNLMMHLLQS